MFGVAGLRFQHLMKRRIGESGWRSATGYGIWIMCWIVGHIAGGAALGALLGWLGEMLPQRAHTIGLLLLSGGCLVWALHQFRLIRLPMPQLHRQVARAWMQRLPWNSVALGYGVQLGCGVATRIKVATTYAVIGCALLSESAIAGSLILGLFGVARSILPVALAQHAASPERSFSVAQGFSTHEQLVSKLNGVGLLVTSAFLFSIFWQVKEAW